MVQCGMIERPAGRRPFPTPPLGRTPPAFNTVMATTHASTNRALMTSPAGSSPYE
jgi:hypothetical protein